jgi:hypothetical protein
MQRKVLSLILLTLFLVCGAQAQTTQSTQTENKDADVNLETQLYLILGTNQAVPDSKIPSSLDPVIKQLRATLPFKNYRLATTLINRVKNEGKLEIVGIGSSLAATPEPGQPITRSSFRVRDIRLFRGSEGQLMVQVAGFGFNASIPVVANGAAIAANNAAPPVFAYEGASLGTDISMRESEPVIVGTLNVGPSGDAIILVLAAKRTEK